jgi:hypothetical protein
LILGEEMAIAAKSPAANPDGHLPAYMPKPRGFWQRWNRQTSLVVFVIGIGALWLAVSLLLVIEIQ